MNIKKDFRNELFKRQELAVEIRSEKNPGFEGVRKIVAEKTGNAEENIDVKGVAGGFGIKVFEGKVYVYDSKNDLEEMKKLEMTAKQRKNSKEEKKAVEKNKQKKEEV